ncbi:hypothetical protein BKI52_08325 [marine bacterium AO1-C]|nr:hypothetical protein BKI52_08325 [marine bacterium AO1-C]
MKTSKIINRLFALILLTTVFVACQDQATQEEVNPLPTLDSPSATIKLCEPVIVFPRVTWNEFYDRDRRTCVPLRNSFCLDPSTAGVRLICHEIELKEIPHPCIKPLCGKYPLIPRELFEKPEIDASIIFPYEDYLVIQRIKKFDEEVKNSVTTFAKPLDIGKELAAELKLSGNLIKPGKYITIPNVREAMESIFIPKENLGR